MSALTKKAFALLAYANSTGACTALCVILAADTAEAACILGGIARANGPESWAFCPGPQTAPNIGAFLSADAGIEHWAATRRIGKVLESSTHFRLQRMPLME